MIKAESAHTQTTEPQMSKGAVFGSRHSSPRSLRERHHEVHEVERPQHDEEPPPAEVLSEDAAQHRTQGDPQVDPGDLQAREPARVSSGG